MGIDHIQAYWASWGDNWVMDLEIEAIGAFESAIPVKSQIPLLSGHQGGHHTPSAVMLQHRISVVE